MSATAGKLLRLAAENGRRVGRITKARRQAATPAMEVARLRRSIAEIREEALKVHQRAEKARKVLEAAFVLAGNEDRVLARAMAREALIECGHALTISMVVRLCEMAEEGTLCA